MIDKSDWQPQARTTVAAHYLYDDRILIVWPDDGALDTGESAAENRDFQHAFFRDRGIQGAVAIYFDRIAGQDRDARRIYSTDMDPELAGCIAMIGGSRLTRALISFFVGFSPSRMPFKLFPTLEAALPWINEQLGPK